MDQQSTKELALQELKHYQTDDALAILEAVEAKRRAKHHSKYFTPIAPQVPIFEKFTSDVKILGVLGGNRSGKTEAGAFLAAVWFLGKDYFRGEPAWEYVKNLPVPDPPNNIWVVGLDFSVLRDVIWREKLRYGKQHPPFIPEDDEHEIIEKVTDSDFQIFSKKGSIITGKSADSGRAKFQGASVDLVWIDEECEGEVFDECYQRTSDCAGKLLLTLTPLTDVSSGVRTPWVFNLYQDWKGGQPDLEFVRLSVLDNPFIPQVEKDKLIHKWTGHVEEKARLYGDFVQRSGMVYHHWNPKCHFVKPFNIPPSWKRVCSIDPAATGITAALWGAFSEKGDLYLYREYYEANHIISEHAKNILLLNAGGIVDVWIIDPKYATQRNAESHKTILQLYRESGIPCRIPNVGPDYGVNVSREYVRATTEPTSRHPKLYVFNHLKHFQSEIEGYVWAFFGKGELKGLSKEKPIKRNDHLMNAYQYMATLRMKGLRARQTSREDKIRMTKLNSYT